MDEVFFNSIVGACEIAARWREAVHLLSGASSRFGFHANQILFNSAIDACAVGQQWQRMLQALSTMAWHRLAPDVLTYSSMIGCAPEGEEWRQSVWLLTGMRGGGVRANIVTLKAVVDSYAESGRCRELPSYLDVLSSCTDADGELAAQDTAEEFSCGLGATVASIDTLYFHGRLSTDMGIEFQSFLRAHVFPTLTGLCRPEGLLLEAHGLEQIPHLGEFHTLDAMFRLGMVRPDFSYYMAWPRLMARREMPLVDAGWPLNNPTAKKIAAWVQFAVNGGSTAASPVEVSHRLEGGVPHAEPRRRTHQTVCRGRVSGYGGVVHDGATRNLKASLQPTLVLLVPVLAEHDRSGHAEFHALLALLSTWSGVRAIPESTTGRLESHAC